MKKIIASVMAAGIALSSLIPFASANIMPIEGYESVSSVSSSGKVQSTEPTTTELEKIIKLVKPKLDVPEECTEFSWNYTAPNYYRTASWRMTWYDKEYNKEVNVSCDADGNITSYSYYDYSQERGIKLPEYSKDELEKTAFAFLEKLCPEAASDMKLESAYASSLYSQSFIYRYVRYENGVLVPDNSATINVNYITGIPTSLSCTYNYSVDFADKAVIDAETAKQSLSGKQTMNLSYRMKNEYDADGKLTERKAYLIYTPSVSYLSCDAVTGEVYTERNTWTVQDKAESMAGGSSNGLFNDAMADSAAPESSREYELSEEELAQLEVLENLLTRQDAIDVILKNEYLYINSGATAVDAQLSKKSDYSYYYASADQENKDLYQWNISFSAPYNAAATKEESIAEAYFRPYMNAVVDAQDGSIISYSANVPGYYYFANTEQLDEIPENKFTAEQAQEIFTGFAKTVIPEKVENTRVSAVNDSVVINYTEADKDGNQMPLYRSASVRLVRVNEGVDFTYNSISGEVDRVSGKITRFSYNWYDNVVFESPADAITPEEAYRVLLDSDGFGLNYEINSNYTYKQYLADSESGYVDTNELYETEQYTRLVYSGYSYLSTTVSALTGELINYSGTPVKRDVETKYTDIENHWAQSDIEKLSDLGLGFEGAEFKPDSEITAEEFLQLMNRFGKYASESLTEEQDTAQSLTRTQAVKHIIDSAGYYKIACMPDIFITDFADNSELKREDVGFIAIARGFGLVQGSANEFRPYDNLTRAEAVTLIFNFVKLSD